MTEAPDKPPNPYPGQYTSTEVKPEPHDDLGYIKNTGDLLVNNNKYEVVFYVDM